MGSVKNFIQHFLTKRRIKNFSNLDEQSLIYKYVDELKIKDKYCVDIAASDGVSMSNTYALFRDGWKGLAVEYDPQKFSKLSRSYRKFLDVDLANRKVTPLNVTSLLNDHNVPVKFGFLSLDIDGYDYFVLEQILGEFRPALICTEINEKIPPPLKFTVKWDPKYAWNEDHFYGQSISQLHLLCTQFKYALVELNYNNAFLIPQEVNVYPELTPEEAYRKGYQEQSDRKKKFPWNDNMEEILSLPPEEAKKFVNSFFSKYQGQFECSF